MDLIKTRMILKNLLKAVKQKTYPRIRKILDNKYIKALNRYIKYHPITLKVSHYLRAFAGVSKEKFLKINQLLKLE